MNNMTEITLMGIARRQKSRAPMKSIEHCHISIEAGVEDDFRGKPGKRQVSVLSQQAWQLACNEVQQPLPWTTRRANLLISGYQFSQRDVGKQIHIGDVQLLVCKETDPCPRMDEQCDGLTAALTPDWRGGVCCKVIQGGDIQLGDSVTIVSTETAS